MDEQGKKARQRLLARQAQPVPMPVACSLVYHHLNRDIGNLALGPGYASALNSTALALSQVADIYYIDESRLLRIPGEELAGGAFEESGAAYRAASGRLYRSLSMRRIDLMEALTVLSRARAAIDAARARPAAPPRGSAASARTPRARG